MQKKTEAECQPFTTVSACQTTFISCHLDCVPLAGTKETHLTESPSLRTKRLPKRLGHSSAEHLRALLNWSGFKHVLKMKHLLYFFATSGPLRLTPIFFYINLEIFHKLFCINCMLKEVNTSPVSNPIRFTIMNNIKRTKKMFQALPVVLGCQYT